MSEPTVSWPSDRRPLSVVVFGNSIPALQMPARPSRESGVYLEVLADQLTAAGIPVTTHLEARWFDFLVHGVREYQSRVRNHLPDVLIVHYGLNEYQPWLAPIWLLRHFLRDESATRPTRAYRTHVAPRLWALIREYRRWAAPKIGTRTWQTTPDRFAGHLGHLIKRARWELAPLILVLDIDAPGDRLEHFLPGMQKRHGIYQQTIERVVAEANHADVRLFRISEVTRALGPTATPDGMHYSGATHRRIGEALAAEIVEWVRSGRR